MPCLNAVCACACLGLAPPCPALLQAPAPRSALLRFGDALGLGTPGIQVGRPARQPASRGGGRACCIAATLPHTGAMFHCLATHATPATLSWLWLPSSPAVCNHDPACALLPCCPAPLCFLFWQEVDSPVKATDFGLSIRHRPEDHPLKSRSGTPAYMAPEVRQLGGQCAAELRSGDATLGWC